MAPSPKPPARAIGQRVYNAHNREAMCRCAWCAAWREIEPVLGCSD